MKCSYCGIEYKKIHPIPKCPICNKEMKFGTFDYYCSVHPKKRHPHVHSQNGYFACTCPPFSWIVHETGKLILKEDVWNE
ncbi:MAG: hypothetical protein ACTSUK_05665 [Promethearchaeota archaeon]